MTALATARSADEEGEGGQAARARDAQSAAHAAPAKANGSPASLEVTLTGISDEVMEDAIARRAKLSDMKP